MIRFLCSENEYLNYDFRKLIVAKLLGVDTNHGLLQSQFLSLLLQLCVDCVVSAMIHVSGHIMPLCLTQNFQRNISLDLNISDNCYLNRDQ
jgi:hypothetical protein